MCVFCVLSHSLAFSPSLCGKPGQVFCCPVGIDVCMCVHYVLLYDVYVCLIKRIVKSPLFTLLIIAGHLAMAIKKLDL